MVEHLKATKKHNSPIEGTIKIYYEDWCPVPPFDEKEVSRHNWLDVVVLLIFLKFILLLFLFCVVW